MSPSSWDSYPSIGRNGSFLSDKAAVTDVLGDLPSGTNEMTISPDQASRLEQAMGLNEGSLQNGFKIREVSGIQEMAPRSPIAYPNPNFQGAGSHLPGGGPEVVINSIPTIDGPGVTTIMKVTVKP